MNLTKLANRNKMFPQSLINILTGGFMLLPLAKNIKRFFSCRKELLIVVLAIAISSGAGIAAFAYLEKDVVIYDNGVKTTCRTMKNTFAKVLDQNNIDVATCDYVSIPLETSLQRTKLNEIYIKRAVPVYITADGSKTEVMTYRDTVGELIKDGSIKLGTLDRLEGAALEDKVNENMSINVVRVNESVVSEEEEIPYDVQRQANKSLDKGTERVVQHGQEGVLEKKYKVVTENGTEVSRELLSEAIIKNPVAMVMEYGTILNYRTARGDTVRYSKVMDMKATAYTASFKDTGKHPGHPLFGITATGARVKKGIIAVDPKVIPLGTRVYVEFVGKTPDYGYAVAADVGGAIKGNKIDLYYDSQDYVDKFGVKKVRVYILNK